MKKKVLMFVILTLGCVLYGCGKKEEIVQPTTDSIITSETVASEMNQSDSEEEVTGIMKEDPGAVMSLENNLENMLMPMDALMMCMVENNYEYNVSDPTVFWASLYYMLGNYGTKRDLVTVGNSDMTVPRQVVQEYATALFADYEELPEIPENLKAAIHYEEDSDSYIVSLGDRGMSQSKVVDYADNGDGTYTVVARLCGTDDDSTICEWNFTLVENSYADGIQNPLFLYSIKNMQKIEEIQK